MIDLALDNSGDLLIEDFDLKLINGVDQIAQNLAIRLRFFMNDYFLDITAGIPYYEDFFIKAPNQIRIESLLKDEILQTEGIEEILSFSSNFDSSLRKFSVNFTARSVDGDFELGIEVP